MTSTLKIILEKLLLPKFVGIIGMEVTKNPMSKFYIVTYLTDDEFDEDDKLDIQFETDELFRMLGHSEGEGAMVRFKYVRKDSN